MSDARALVALFSLSAIIALWVILLMRPRSRVLHSRRAGLRLVLGVTLGLSSVTAGFSEAFFVEAVVNGSNSFSTLTLAAPTGLTASPYGTTVNLSWTATSSTRATGHRVLRATSAGGPYSQIAQIAPRTTTTYADSPGGGTFYYVVRSYYDAGGANWFSANSNSASATASVYAGKILATAGLISYWRLGEAVGVTTAVDQKGPNEGTYVSGVALGQAGAITGDPDTAAGFDGVDDRVSVPDFAPPVNLSLEAWIYPQDTATGNDRIIIDKSNNEYDLRINVNGNLQFITGGISAIDTTLNFATPANANRWYHVVVTFDDAANTVSFYRDGCLTRTVSGFTGLVQDTVSELRIGRHSTLTLPSFNGRIDEAAIYNVPLTLATIQNHYGGGCAYDQMILADGPSSYWRLGEAAGATTGVDVTGARNGTYLNGVALGQPDALPNSANTAAAFDGVDDYAEMGDAYDFAGTVPFSIEFWMKKDVQQATVYSRLVDKGTIPAPRTGWDSAIVPNSDAGNAGRILFERWSSGTANVAMSTTVTAIGTWYHVVATYDGANIRLYVNGVLESTQASTIAMADTTVPLRLAGNPAAIGGGYLDGSLDEVAIYNVALSAAQVLEHYQGR